MALGEYWPAVAGYYCVHGVHSPQRCYQCAPAVAVWPATTGTYSFTWPVTPKGWQRPACQRVMAPDLKLCPYEPAAAEAEAAPGPVEDLPDREREMLARGAPAPAITLPAEMAAEGYVRQAGIGQDWHEVLPGIEARCTAFRAWDEKMRADVDFRLAPSDDSA